jgi:hypothetical protein
MKKIIILLTLLLTYKSLSNFNQLEYSSRTTVYRSIPFYSHVFKILGYKVLTYGCIDIVYFKEKKIRNTSGYFGICSIEQINEDIKTLEKEE